MGGGRTALHGEDPYHPSSFDLIKGVNCHASGTVNNGAPPKADAIVVYYSSSSKSMYIRLISVVYRLCHVGFLLT